MTLTIPPRPAKADRAKPHRLTASEVRTLVRHRDGYKCRLCGMTSCQHWRKYKKKLDVHRVVPGSRYTLKGCFAVCRKCHGPLPKSASDPAGGGIYVRLPLSQFRLFEEYVKSVVPGTTKQAVAALFILWGLQRVGVMPTPPTEEEKPS